MRLLAVSTLLLLVVVVISAVAGKDVALHRQLTKEARSEIAVEAENEETDVSVEEEGSPMEVMESPMLMNNEASVNNAVKVNKTKHDEGKVFTLSNHHLHDLHLDFLGGEATKRPRTTRYPTQYPTRYPPTKYTTKRPTDPPHSHYPYPHPHPHPHPYPYPHRPPFPPPPPYYRPPPPYGFPPYGPPPYLPWWLLRPPGRPPNKTTTNSGAHSGPAAQTAPPVRQQPSRRRPPTNRPNIDNAYKDYIQSLRPTQPMPVYMSIGGQPGQSQVVSPMNYLYNPAMNQLIPITDATKPLYVQTSVSTSPNSSVLSLSTSLSSSGQHHPAVSTTQNATPMMPAVQESQLTRIQMPLPETVAAESTVNKTPTVAADQQPPPAAGNQTFCDVFGWICESNSKVKVAQLENPSSPSTPYVVLLVQPPAPTQVTYMKSAE